MTSNLQGKVSNGTKSFSFVRWTYQFGIRIVCINSKTKKDVSIADYSPNADETNFTKVSQGQFC